MPTNSIRPTMTARGWCIVGIALLAAGMSRGALGNPDLGRWGPVIPWPHVPVSAANLPDGRLLTWASNHPDRFPAGFTYTYAATWDPETGTFQDAAHPSHDLFCGHHVLLEDGRVFSNGGNNVNPTSVFDHHTNLWTKIQPMSRSRWYPSTVALGNGEVFTALGTGGGNYPELWDLTQGWRALTGIDLNAPILSHTSYFEHNWTPLFHLAPNGKVFHSGPTPRMHYLDPVGNGNITETGAPVSDWYPKDSVSILYDVGRLLVAGGAIGRVSAGGTNKAKIIDLNSDPPQVIPIAPMRYARRFGNGVPLPTGEVMVVGGNTDGGRFNDATAVYPAEVWNPATGAWRLLAPMQVPRTYHSWALLMPDARVVVGGGGLCGTSCAVNHPDIQIFSPPYLFRANGSPAPRPVITAAPATVAHGGSYTVEVNADITPNITRFSLIRLSAVTHSNNSDVRNLAVPFTKIASAQYRLTLHTNPNVLVPGYWMLFAVDAAGVPSVARTIKIATGRPEITNPGNQAHLVGTQVVLNISAKDRDGDALRYRATGLPPGLVIEPVAGRISGAPTQTGNYHVTVTASDDGDGSTSASFAWSVLAVSAVDAGSAAGITYEYYEGTGWTKLPDFDALVPIKTGIVGQFSLSPRTRGVNFGFRYRARIRIATGGSYTFYTHSDAGSRFWVDGTLVVDNDGLHTARERSGSIDLAAGEHSIVAAYFQTTDSFVFNVSYAGPGIAKRIIPASVLLQPSAGLNFEYYEGVWKVLPDFDALVPKKTGLISVFDLWPRLRSDNFAMRFRGKLRVTAAGSYTFYTASNAGSKLWVDAAPVVVNDGLQSSANEKSGTAFLQAGDHDLTVTYFEVLGDESLQVRYSGPGIAKRPIPASALPTNRHPSIAPLGDRQWALGGGVNVQIGAADPDGDPLTYGATGLPEGVYISSATGRITGTATAPGTYPVTVTVRDPRGGAAGTSAVWTVFGSLTLAAPAAPPRPVGTTVSYTADTTGGVNPTFRWQFGDGTPETPRSSSPSASHVYQQPGRYIVTLRAGDDTGASLLRQFVQAVHLPLTAARPNVSTGIVYEVRGAGDRVWNVNPDNDTVSVFDAITYTKRAEIGVGLDPRGLAIAPDGRVWVTNRRSATISIISPDTLQVVATLALPHASQPYGIAFAPAGTFGFVTMEARGELLRLHPGTGAETGRLALGPHPRHLSVSTDGATVLVSRFVTPPLPGEDTANPQTVVGGVQRGAEVVVVRAADLTVAKTITLRHSDRADTEQGARGVPNYLGPAVISPDGRSAWVPSKQDNLLRGRLRDGRDLDFESTVRSISSRIVMDSKTEDHVGRIDHDNGGVASTGVFDRYGYYLFVALEGSREVAVIDAHGKDEITRLAVGRAPQGLVLSPDSLTLYVHNFMDRTITVLDTSDIVLRGGIGAPTLALRQAVASERLSPRVLRGKQLFYDSQDPRLARDRYLSCAACHADGGQDGRVWDLTGLGEGLRNTIGLEGRAGLGHGPLHWSANFDEVQDFEGQIRNLAGGSGLMSDADFNTGTRAQPLGDPKAGISADLDALAAYLASLQAVAPSPYRNPDGSLTTQGLAGQALFAAEGCSQCHGAPRFTDSAPDHLHDIGTVKPASGGRLSGPLTGIDTPTLRGIWDTAPYLHDGSAATLRDAINAHPGVSLSAAEMAQIEAYLRQIDHH